MKLLNTKRIALIGVAAVLAMLIAGCAGVGVSIEDRISQFESDINAGRFDQLYKHFDSASTQMYDQIKAESFWNTKFETDRDYTITISNISGLTVTASLSGGIYNNTALTFTMVEVEGSGLLAGSEYFIRSISGAFTVN